MVKPSIEVLPVGAVGSEGARAVELAAGAGLELDAAQRQVLHGALGVDADGGFVADNVAIIVARQNLKTTVVMARILLGLSRGEQVLYTAHRVDSAAEVFKQLVALVQASPELEPQLTRVIYSNGREAVHLANGGRVLFGTRSTSRTGRGFSLDTIVVDEAHFAAEEQLLALVPTVSARERPVQIWFCASAVDEEVHEHGLVMARLRERALGGDAQGLAFFEWSVRFFDNAGQELSAGDVSPEMVDSEALWALANPAIEAGRMRIERLRAERASLPHRGWIVERLSIGAYPDTSGVVAAPISAEQWEALLDRESKRVGDVTFSFDVAPDRRCALVACGLRSDDRLHVELLRSAQGTSWLVDDLLGLHERYDVHATVCDGYGGNIPVAKLLEDAGIEVRTLTGGEHAAACSRLLDLVAEGGFRHIGQIELLNALRGAKAKPVGDSWAWSRKQSVGDIAAVVAMTLALAVGVPTVEWQPQVF